MDTYFFAGNKKFFHAELEKSTSLPFFVFPAVWVESKKMGLSTSSFRVTLGLFRYRWHMQFGKRYEHPNPSMKLPAGFADWASDWSKSSISLHEFESWLRQSSFQEVVRWGGSNYHYTKIILVREFVNARSKSLAAKVSHQIQGPDDVSLDITWDDVNVPSVTLDGDAGGESLSGYTKQ